MSILDLRKHLDFLSLIDNRDSPISYENFCYIQIKNFQKSYIYQKIFNKLIFF